MELTALCPDVSTWRHDRYEACVLDGIEVPGLFRDVYRYRDVGATEDTFSCAFYALNGKRVLSVWGVVGGADCCRYHQMEGEVLTGAPEMSYDAVAHIVRINQVTFSA